MVFAIDSNVHLGNKNRSLAVNIGDKAFDPHAGNAKLFQYVGKINVRNIAKDGKNF